VVLVFFSEGAHFWGKIIALFRAHSAEALSSMAMFSKGYSG